MMGVSVSWRITLLYCLMIVAGVMVGLSHVDWLHRVALVIADMFIRLFKCISLPIIFLSIVVTLSHYRSDGLMRRVWLRTLCYTLGTTLVAALVSCVLYQIISPELVKTDTAKAVALPLTSYAEHLSLLIPDSLLSPFIENQVLSVLFLGILMGLAIRFIPDREAKITITHFFRGAHSLMMVITRWVIMIIPLGLFAFVTSTVLQLRTGTDLAGVGQYLLVIVLANLIQGFVVLPVWLTYHGIKPFSAMQAMLPALSLAFFSKSSVGSLPVTIDTIEKNLHVSPQISRFVLPLCTTINMNGCAAFIFTTVVYMMQNNGVMMPFSSMVLWVVVATIAAIGNAGIPMGCFFLSVSLLVSMNVPITLMGVILPFYSLIDMLETALNVWSDSCVTKVINDRMLDGEGVVHS